MWILQAEGVEGDRGRTFRLSSGTVKTLGRATRADFILEAALVSRLHCRLTAKPSGELVVEDLCSTNGTFVNGQRVSVRPLVDGDRLQVGRVALTVLCQDGAR